MDWIERFDLFLFDFDGLLVDSEELHFRAYKELCARRGYLLPWSLDKYLEIAHADAVGIRREIHKLFPQIFEEPWEQLYAEKKQIYQGFLSGGELKLMTGVEQLLQSLEAKNKKRCVVTNSTAAQTEAIKAQLPVLNTIPHWFTRESYANPKPAPDGYLKALSALKSDADRVIGFEDSMRGIVSLKDARVDTLILICHSSHPQLRTPLSENIRHVSSFEEMPKLFQ